MINSIGKMMISIVLMHARSIAIVLLALLLGFGMVIDKSINFKQMVFCVKCNNSNLELGELKMLICKQYVCLMCLNYYKSNNLKRVFCKNCNKNHNIGNILDNIHIGDDLSDIKIDSNDLIKIDVNSIDDDREIFIDENVSVYNNWENGLTEVFINKLTRGFRVIHLNINSVKAKLDEVESLCKLDMFDMILLQESKLDDSYPDELFNFFDYSVHRRDRVSNGGGILTLIKKRFNVISMKADSKIESIHYKIEFKSQIFNLVTVYRPPPSKKNKMNELTFLEHLKSQLDKIDNTQSIFIVGDINLDLLSDKGINLRKFVNSSNFNFVDDVKPTRLVSGTLLDVVLTNNLDSIINHFVHPCSFSDHCFVIFEFKFVIKQEKKDNIFIRRLTDDKLELINANLSNTSFDFLNSVIDINDKWLLFKKILLNAIDNLCPKVKVKHKAKRLPWLDATTFKLRHYRDKLYYKAISTKSQVDWDLYKKIRNEYNMVIKVKMRDYFFDKDASFFKSSKKYWNFYKKFVKTKQSSNKNSVDCNEFLYNNEKLNEPAVISNSFNKFFTTFQAPKDLNKTECASETFDRFRKLKKTNKLNKLNSLKFEFKTVNREKIEKLLIKLDNKTSPGISEIPVSVIKNSASVLASPICEMINCCIECGNIPNEWKFAVVTPLYKGKGDYTDFNSYRGISVLPPIAKIFEKVLQEQILEYFNLNNLFHSSQHGFRSGFSCETALHEIINKWLEKFKSNEVILAIFIDFMKAFDFVNSDILLIKLQCYGFMSSALKLILGYFCDRKQIVKFKNTLSDPGNIELGVPQGSIVGPLFFLIFINDLLFDFDDEENAKLFADDTTIYNSGIDCDSAFKNLSNDVDLMLNWSKINCLKINWSKTYLMCISDKKNKNNKHIIYPLNLNICGHDVEVVSKFKLLGVILDNNLNFIENFENTSRKVYSSLFSLKSKFFLSKETKLQFFKTFILPLFDYCISLIIYYSLDLRNKLVKLYKFCLRKLLNISFSDNKGEPLSSNECNSLLMNFNLFSFEHRVLYRLSLFIFKINLHQYPSNLYRYLSFNFNEDKGHYNLRNRDKLCVPNSLKLNDKHFSVFFSKFINLTTIYVLNDSFLIF